MINLIIFIYSFFYSHNELQNYKKTNRIMWVFANTMYRMCLFVLYYSLRLRKTLGNMPAKLDRNGNVIVSLTSFPARINDVWMVIDSIMRQSTTPDRIILYLSKEQFPAEEKDIPQTLIDYKRLGLEIEFRDDDLKPHKKYFYAFLDNPDSIVITIDDDIYYQRDTIERLMDLHEQFPGAVCSNNINEITFDADRRVNTYSKWTTNCSKQFSPSHQLLAIGYGGVLYPVILFKDERMFDANPIKEHCLRADDLWLKAFELLNDIPVVTGDYFCPSPQLIGSQTISLKSSNCDETIPQNDVQWKNLDGLFNLEELLNKDRQ